MPSSTPTASLRATELGLDHVTRAGNQQRVRRIRDQQHRFQPAQHAIADGAYVDAISIDHRQRVRLPPTGMRHDGSRICAGLQE